MKAAGQLSTRVDKKQGDSSHWDQNLNCSKWVVTDFQAVWDEWHVASKIVRSLNRISNRLNETNWCVLAVISNTTARTTRDDLQSSEEFLTKVALEENLSWPSPNNFLWLSKQRYESWCQSAPVAAKDFCELVSPDDSYVSARNVGYFYAILHGARSILEVSRDYFTADYSDAWWNAILLDINNDTSHPGVGIASLGFHLFNPVPILFEGLARPLTEPYGFPSEYRNESCTHGTIAFIKRGEPSYKEEIKNILHWPKQQRFHGTVTQFFLSHQNGATTVLKKLVEAPSHAFAPFSLQPGEGGGFVLWSKYTLWALLLPTSFASEPLNDVMRSYMAQTLFRDADSKVHFHLIGQNQLIYNRNNSNGDRDPHGDNVIGLVKFLQTWSSSSSPRKDSLWTVDELMEVLWQDLAEAGFLSSQDVRLVQLWRKALIELQIKTEVVEDAVILPPLRPRVSNVVVMGQFNYGHIPVRNIIFWVQKYLEYFSHVTVRGPFSDKTLEDLSSQGILAYSGPDESGYWAPLQNLMQTLIDVESQNREAESQDRDSPSLQPRHSYKIEGVMYVHDDGILNMTRIFSKAATMNQQKYRHGVFPTKVIMTSSEFTDPRSDILQQERSVTYKIFPNGSLFSVMERTEIETYATTLTDFAKFEAFIKPLWPHFRACLRGQLKLTQNPSSARYRESDGSILFSTNAQSDFLYVPIDLTSEFSYAARLHLHESPIFLECSLPTVVDMVRSKTNINVTSIGLCTIFGSRNGRGKPEMIFNCMKSPEQGGDGTFGLYHPYKLSRGLEDWNHMFDALAG